MDNTITITGKVLPGRKIGRALGFPTANVALPSAAAVRDGVYAARVGVDGSFYWAMAYVGRRPSVEAGGRRLLEVHLFDFEGDLYDKEIRAELVAFVRPGVSFESLDELRGQIESDEKEIFKILKTYCPAAGGSDNGE